MILASEFIKIVYTTFDYSEPHTFNVATGNYPILCGPTQKGRLAQGCDDIILVMVGCVNR